MAEFPALYKIYRGEVASIQSYGAFVKIDGYKKNGLVHKSQISRTKRVEDVSEVLSVGDIIWSKVISLGEDEEKKISLSMKVVNQDNGQDLDPNMVQTKQEEQRRKKGGYVPKPKIELGAVLNTTCKKCGTVGHLTQDCFYKPGEKTYDLIPDIDMSMLSHSQPDVTHSKEKGHKHKKKKKKIKRASSIDTSNSEDERGPRRKSKKKKKHRKKVSSSESESTEEESSEEERRKRKRKKDRKKKKKEKRDVSLSDSDSDDSYDYSKKSKKHSTSKGEREKIKDIRLKDSSVERRDKDRGKKRHKHSSSDEDTYHRKHKVDRIHHHSRTQDTERRNDEKERNFDRKKERSPDSDDAYHHHHHRHHHHHHEEWKGSVDSRKDRGREDFWKERRDRGRQRKTGSCDESDDYKKNRRTEKREGKDSDGRDWDRQKRRAERDDNESDIDNGYHKHHSNMGRYRDSRSDRKNVMKKDWKKEGSYDR